MSTRRPHSNSITSVLWISGALALVVVGPYIFRFHSGLPHDPKTWADFGTYIGGTLGPIYAFLAFLVGLLTLQQIRNQNRREEILKTIQAYENDFEIYASKPVSCNQPWIWGNDPGAARQISEVSLRTLLFYDGIDWEHHLSEIFGGLKFRVLPDGELVQDRDLWLRAHMAIEGLFHHLDRYRESGGEQSLVDYYTGRYEVPRNRLKFTDKWPSITPPPENA